MDELSLRSSSGAAQFVFASLEIEPQAFVRFLDNDLRITGNVCRLTGLVRE